MKKIFMSLAALMMMAAPVMTSCSSDLDEEAPEVVCPENGTHEETITIAFPDQTETRVAVDDAHKLTGWEMGDEVTLVRTKYEVFPVDGHFDISYTLDATYTFRCTDAANGTFTGTLPNGTSVNDCQLAFYNATGFATSTYETSLYFSPKIRASQDMKDVIMLVAENDGEGHFAMKIFGSILQFTNYFNADVTASVKYKKFGNSRYYDNNQVLFDVSASTYSSWSNNIDASVKHPITFSKGSTTYVYIPTFGDGGEYSVGLSAEGDEEGECSLVPFKANPGNAKLYKKTVYYGRGTAKATIGGGEVDVTWLQLWEDGPKFAEYNVGVTDGKAESVGGYYCWGGSKDQDSSVRYKAGNDPLSGTDDTATNLWGSAWRMPTKEELQALLDNCDSEWIKVNAVYGRIFTGMGDHACNSVFLPAAGYYDLLVDSSDRGIQWRTYNGYYLSSTPDGSDKAYELKFHLFKEQMVESNSRNIGYSIRAVLAE